MSTLLVPVHRGNRWAPTLRTYAMIDADDLALVAGRRWCASPTYAISRVDGRIAYMHRLILGLDPGDGMLADHVNRDTFDNCRENLRIATPTENSMNRPASATTTSRFRGVFWLQGRGKWTAKAQLHRHRYFLGEHEREEDAAAAVAAFWAEHASFPLELEASA